MRRKCENCGNIFYNTTICPNCERITLTTQPEDDTQYNRYASKKMTQEKAMEFFETDKY